MNLVGVFGIAKNLNLVLATNKRNKRNKSTSHLPRRGIACHLRLEK